MRGWEMTSQLKHMCARVRNRVQIFRNHVTSQWALRLTCASVPDLEGNNRAN